jgi:hypothetical protein
MDDRNRRQPANHVEEGDTTGRILSDELVKAVADRVYALLLREIQIEAERSRVWTGHASTRLGGGRAS